MKTRMRPILINLALYSFLWWTFTDGSVSQLWIGGVVVTLVILVKLRFRIGEGFLARTSLRAVLHFVPYFIFQSLKGGFFVALLAVLPWKPIRSRYFDFETRIPEDATLARMWFASTLCIFPGTLSCGYRGQTLIVHALDVSLYDEVEIRELEALIFEIFPAEILQES